MRYQNMEECECDRCGRKEFLTVDAPSQSEWHDMLRITIDGNKQPFLLCKDCYGKYRTFMNEQDKSFALFMGGK